MLSFITAEIYAALFVFFILTIPPLFIADAVGVITNHRGLWQIVALLVGGTFNATLLAFIRRRNDTVQFSFQEGLSAICSTLMSGCSNITVLYILPVLLVVYVIVVTNTLIGLIKGKTYTQKRWIELIRWFDKHRWFLR